MIRLNSHRVLLCGVMSTILVAAGCDRNMPTPVGDGAKQPSTRRHAAATTSTTGAIDPNGTTALHLAALKGDLAAAAALIALGADVNAKERCGETPLYDAVAGNNVAMIRFLAGKGADVHVDAMGITLAEEAVRLNKVFPRGASRAEVVRLLAALGAPLEGASGGSPLMRAAEHADQEMVELLLSLGANPNNARFGLTPLMYAAGRDSKESVAVVRDLLRAGAEVRTRASNGDTALSLAIESGNIEAARLLINAGADVSVADHDRATPLHRAAGGGYVELVRLLLSKGAQADVRDALGFTPLDRAKMNERYPSRAAGCREVVSILKASPQSSTQPK